MKNLLTIVLDRMHAGLEKNLEYESLNRTGRESMVEERIESMSRMEFLRLLSESLEELPPAPHSRL